MGKGLESTSRRRKTAQPDNADASSSTRKGSRRSSKAKSMQEDEVEVKRAPGRCEQAILDILEHAGPAAEVIEDPDISSADTSLVSDSEASSPASPPETANRLSQRAIDRIVADTVKSAFQTKLRRYKKSLGKAIQLRNRAVTDLEEDQATYQAFTDEINRLQKIDAVVRGYIQDRDTKYDAMIALLQQEPDGPYGGRRVGPWISNIGSIGEEDRDHEVRALGEMEQLIQHVGDQVVLVKARMDGAEATLVRREEWLGKVKHAVETWEQIVESYQGQSEKDVEV